MESLSVVLALMTQDNDYQQAQAAAAGEVASRAGIKLEVVYADNDAVNQTQQLIRIIQDKERRPSGILVSPVGTDMPQVAKAAVAAGIGWGVLNRSPQYVSELRRSARVPVFAVTTDQEAVGKIQAKQIAALVKEGNVLYIEGPSSSAAAKVRTEQAMRNKPATVELKMIRGDWTQHGAQQAVRSWLSLSTSRQLQVRAVICQNDAMALGARNALTDIVEKDHKKWMTIPFTGCDGLERTGQEWVRRGLLTATIVIPRSAGLALEIMSRALRGSSAPPAATLTDPVSYPTIEELATSGSTIGEETHAH